MLDSLHWRTAIESPDARAQMDDMRASALRVFLTLATAGYIAWHIPNTALFSVEQMRGAYAIAMVVVPVLAAGWALVPRSLGAASVVFVGGALLAISWALHVLNTGQAAMLYPMVALVAAFVVHPLAGFLVAGVAVGLLALLGFARPDLVGAAVIWQVGAFAVIAVVGVWALMHQLFLALNWYVDSYANAERRTREAEEHRAQLAQAWKQLDAAYYRLERLNEELQRARRAAEEARALKAEFAATISHELRTPLNLIVGFSEMMMSNPRAYGGESLPMAYRQHLEAVHRNACSLSRLVDDVLDLSQIEAHRMALERAMVSLPRVVEEAIAAVASLFEHLRLNITVDVPADLPPLYVDANRVRQILINLLNNAARFTESGGVTIRATRDGGDVVVSVADTGSGIAPEDLPYVFDVFRRAGPSDQRRRGSGLGLAICKQFAEMHGGHMWVESQLGRGSTFYLSLPLSEKAVIAPSDHRLPSRVEGERTVVVLDRTSEAARVFQRYLDGYRVVRAAAVDELRRLAVDCPLHALVMADSDGDAGGQQLRISDARFRDLPVFRCSLSTSRTLARELSVEDYLVKPVSRERLVAALRRAGKGAGKGAGKRIREILIVEDEPEMASLLAEMVRASSRRYRVRQAGDGAEALALLRERPADLVLLDLLLPRVSGYEVIREMKSDTALRDVPIVVVSAKGTHDEAVRAKSLDLSRASGLTVGELMGCLRASLDALLRVGSQDNAPERLAAPLA